MGSVRRGRPELCESSTESTWPGACKPVALITTEMGTPAEGGERKETLASVLGSVLLSSKGLQDHGQGQSAWPTLAPWPSLRCAG